MAASSVTGVGQGSAGKVGTKGADDMFLGVEKLIGSRIVFADKVDLSAGTTTLAFGQTLPGVSDDYAVFATLNVVGGGSITSVNVSTTGVTLVVTGSPTVSYMVVRVTNATVTVG